jgi:ABC-2 type transport system ATP-binding protein
MTLGNSGSPFIRAQDVSSRADGNGRDLAAMTFDLPQGVICGLLGDAGSGKTSLLRLIAGHRAADGGMLLVDGYDPAREAHAIATFTTCMAQHADAPSHLHLGEMLTLTGMVRGLSRRVARAAARDLLTESGLAPLAGVRMGMLTSGVARLAAFCIALMGSPRLLLLDEPLEGMDARQRAWVTLMLRGLRNRGTLTILVATAHPRNLDDLADYALVLTDGQMIAAGEPAGLKLRYSKGPRMDLRLAAGTKLTQGIRTKLDMLGEVIIRDDGTLTLYPKPDTLGALARSVPATTMAHAIAKRGRPATAARPEPDDAWLLDRATPLPGSLGRTVEEIFAIIGPDRITEFWFTPPSLEDVLANVRM